jgi:hypothetical protein
MPPDRSERSEGSTLRIRERDPANDLYDEACAANGLREARAPTLGPRHRRQPGALLSGVHSLGTDTISAASPMGRALVGATPGTIVTVELPNRRSRSVRLAEVTMDGVADPRSRAAA